MSEIKTTPVASSVPFDNESNGFVSDSTQEAIEEVREEGGSARMAISFGYDNNASTNTWLQTFRGVSSRRSPFVVAEEGTLTSLSVSYRNNETTTFSVYLNGTITDTLSVTSDNRGFVDGLSTALVAGDEISVRITSGEARDIAFWVKIKTVSS